MANVSAPTLLLHIGKLLNDSRKLLFIKNTFSVTLDPAHRNVKKITTGFFERFDCQNHVECSHSHTRHCGPCVKDVFSRLLIAHDIEETLYTCSRLTSHTVREELSASCGGARGPQLTRRPPFQSHSSTPPKWTFSRTPYDSISSDVIHRRDEPEYGTLHREYFRTVVNSVRIMHACTLIRKSALQILILVLIA